MKKLDLSLYRELEGLVAAHKENVLAQQKEKNEATRDDWYALSYPVFKEQPLERIEDLWKFVAFAYSWMPRIPVIQHRLINDTEALLEDLKNLRKGETACRQRVLDTLVPVINKSVVGTSKVLHFIAPDYVPIIDSRVVRGWNLFFHELNAGKYDVIRLPQTMTSLGIEKYLVYWEVMEQWSENCRVTMREIEVRLFELGEG